MNDVFRNKLKANGGRKLETYFGIKKVLSNRKLKKELV
jgi:hypothetical protein